MLCGVCIDSGVQVVVCVVEVVVVYKVVLMFDMLVFVDVCVGIDWYFVQLDINVIFVLFDVEQDCVVVDGWVEKVIYVMCE